MSRLTENKTENMLIAEFIGEDFFNNKIIKDCYYPNMKFKTSWDWLMPVVEKVLDICFEIDEITGEELNDPEDFYAIRDCIPDIEHTYNAVVEFINYYNKNS